MGFIDEYKKGLSGDGGEEYEVNGIKVTCLHCKSTLFSEHEAQLNTRGLTFLGLDWFNKAGFALVCESCGKIEWFLAKPTKR
ncbi:MAG: DNA-binding protein [Coriobacteriales bacterium]|jgi:ribosomal protein S27E|nr:DNA-binding protein [Coriobacteriales bacterium]